MDESMSTNALANNQLTLSDHGLTAYENLKHYLLLRFQKPYTTIKVLVLVSSAVKFMATVKNVTGEEKKLIALTAVRDAINLTDLTTEEKTEMITIVDTFGDAAIEEFIKFGRDMISFAREKCEKCEGCSTKCTIC